MKHVLKLFTIMLLIAGVSFVGCNSDNNSSGSDKKTNTFTVGGYLFDITTGATVTSFTIKAITADKDYKGSVAKDGKYTIKDIPYNKDYVIKATAEGYADFTHSADKLSDNPYYWEQIGNGAGDGNDIDEPYMQYYNPVVFRCIPLIPATVQSPAVSINLHDSFTGTTIAAEGNYKLVRSNLDGGVTDLYALGGYDSLTDTIGQFTQDAAAIVGTFTAGTISIEAGMLLYGYTYTLTVYNVPGYQPKNAITISPYQQNTTANYDIALTSQSENDSLNVVGVTNFNGSAYYQTTSRSIIITFDQDIAFDKTSMLNVPSQTALTLETTNSDLDANTITLATETLAAPPAYSAYITYTATGNTLTITLVADSTLLAPDDADDDLTYNLINITNALYVKPATSVSDTSSWTLLTTALTTFDAQASPLKLVVRENDN